MLVLVPDQKQEDLLQQIMRDAHQAAGEIGASIIGGHTGYSAGNIPSAGRSNRPGNSRRTNAGSNKGCPNR